MNGPLLVFSLNYYCNKKIYMFFPCSKVFGPQPALFINNDFLFSVDTFTFLGFYVDQNLNFKEDIRQKFLKISLPFSCNCPIYELSNFKKLLFCIGTLSTQLWYLILEQYYSGS